MGVRSGDHIKWRGGSPTIAASYQPIAAVHTGNGRKPGRQVLVARRKHGVLRSAWTSSSGEFGSSDPGGM